VPVVLHRLDAAHELFGIGAERVRSSSGRRHPGLHSAQLVKTSRDLDITGAPPGKRHERVVVVVDETEVLARRERPAYRGLAARHEPNEHDIRARDHDDRYTPSRVPPRRPPPSIDFRSMRVPPARVSFPPVDRAEILARIDEALATGQLTLGAIGRELEDAFAARHQATHAVAVSSGTSALEIILRAIGVEGREVLVPANTFFATAAAAAHAGARVRFVDCDPATMAIDLDDAAAQIGPDTAAVIAVHIGGLISAAVPALGALCRERGVQLVEDAAHAHGSALDGSAAGRFGIAGAFSFYPTKVMAGGEGGMIVTDDETIAEEARTYRDQGKGSFHANFHTRLGANWRMSEPHAAIVLSQLGRLDEFIAARQQLARRYDAAVDGLGLRSLSIPADAHCNYYKYVAFLPEGVDRTRLKQTMRERFDVGLSGEVYDTPLHEQPVFSHLADRPLPGAEWLCARHICLPIYPSLTDHDVDFVVDSLATVLTEAEACCPGR
jgi:dTDP-4-amino-4,6-dideoxygalactose transaminase